MSEPTQGGTVLSTPESLAFFQHRVGRFALVAGSLSAALLVFGLVSAAVLGGAGQLAAEVRERSFGFHVLAVLLFGAVWLVSLGPPRTRRVLELMEALGFAGSSACYMAMGRDIPLVARPELLVIVAMSFGLIARAAWVPSTARRTALLGALVGLPLLVMTWSVYRAAALNDLVVAVRPYAEDISPAQSVWLATASAGVWWGLAVALASAISQVIYGLRREVQRARRLGQYDLEEKLGEGGMGVVFRARHAMLARPTAVKLLPAERSSENDVARFEREVRQTARLTHPNTITVFDYGRTPEGVFYYAMELLDGADLERIVGATGPMPPERAIHVLEGIAGALSEAHDVGIVHRDLKPSNVMLCTRGGVPDTPKVLDFGLVKQLEEREEDAGLTREGAIAGTPYYMAPEAIRSGVPVDARTDLYAVGAIGYFLVTGEPVFLGARVVEIYASHLHRPPEAPSRRLGRDLPADLEALVLDCLAKEPAERPQSAQELSRRLEACQGHGAWTPERARQWWAREEQRVATLAEASRRGRTAWTGLATISRAGG